MPFSVPENLLQAPTKELGYTRSRDFTLSIRAHDHALHPLWRLGRQPARRLFRTPSLPIAQLLPSNVLGGRDDLEVHCAVNPSTHAETILCLEQLQLNLAQVIAVLTEFAHCSISRNEKCPREAVGQPLWHLT